MARIGHEINQELETVDLLFQKLYTHVAAILDVNYCFMLAVYQPQSDSLDFHLVEHGRPRFLGHSPL
ncbi:MAG TPA: hypothetical protein VE732_06015, partial [Nitrososphaera sp.]|nr:hypothetical protein [Nitrososphaera sp.]